MDAWASVTVLRHASMVNESLSEEELRKKIDIVKNVFSVPFHLTSSLLQKIATLNQIDTNSSRRKHWNFVWDFYITFSIGKYHFIEDADICLVTGDMDILGAATEANCADKVISLNEYLKSVDFSM